MVSDARTDFSMLLSVAVPDCRRVGSWSVDSRLGNSISAEETEAINGTSSKPAELPLLNRRLLKSHSESWHWYS